jgi:hypothetical protein
MEWLPFCVMVLNSCYHRYSYERLYLFKARMEGRESFQLAKKNLPQTDRLLGIDYSRKRWIDVQHIIRTNQCTNPNDKVFGIYALIPFSREVLPPVDYSKSPVDIYEEFTKAIILYEHSIDFLLGWEVRKNLPGLPSWVPDFSTSIPQPVNVKTGRTPLAAMHGSVIDTKALLESKSGQLVLRCHTMGIVSKTAMKWQQVRARDDQFPHVLDWLHFSHCPQDSSSFDSTIALLEDVLTLGDMEYLDDEWSHLKKELHSDLGVAFSTQETDKARSDAIRSINAETSPFMNNHILFVTSSKNFGVCKGEITEGDVVVLVAGCSSPLVIRPNIANFSLVGDAYIYGIMKGEIWPENIITEQLDSIILI